MSQVLDRNREYMVRNYNPSPVAISTRDSQYLIPGGTRHAPAEFPMTLNEIIFVNSMSDIFKIGVLFFEEEFEEDIYAALRITNWREILRADDIDDIILNPTTEKLQKVIAITNHMYFDRIYGEYTQLRRSGRAISGSVERVIKLRQAELHKGIMKSEIKISNVDDTARHQAETDAQMQAMREQIAELKALLAAQAAATATSVVSEPVLDEGAADATKPQAEQSVPKAPAKRPARSSTSKGAKGTKKSEE